MRREGGERLFYTLLVSYVCKHTAEYSDFRQSFCGYMKTGLRHKDEQTESFQRYGLSSGIWPGNYKTVETTAETYVNGNNILFVNQRMPCTA